jgi:hypothetical protein
MKAAGVPLHCWGSKGVVRACRGWRVWVAALPRQECIGVRNKKGSGNHHVVWGGHVARRGVGGGMVSARCGARVGGAKTLKLFHF